MSRTRNDLTLGDLAKIITSKNSGPHLLTIDVFFEDADDYNTVKRSGAVNVAAVARSYQMRPEQVHIISFSDAALGFKVTMDHRTSADDYRSTDILGAQQHMPLAMLSLGEGSSDV